MSDSNKVLEELRSAERHLTHALRLAGMSRGKRGYIAPTIAAALEDVRDAASNIDAPPTRRKSWSRLARTS